MPVLWFFGLYLLTSVAFAVYVRATGDDHPAADAVVTGIDAALVLAFAWRERREILPLLRCANLGPRTLALTAAVALGMGALVEGWFWLAAFVFEFDTYLGPYREHGCPPWMAVVLIVVCPAVFEEVAFRGFLLARLTPLLGTRDALLLQATLFAIIHVSPVVFPSHFLIGLCLGWLRLRTGSLWPGVVLHAAWNLKVLVAEGLLHGW